MRAVRKNRFQKSNLRLIWINCIVPRVSKTIGGRLNEMTRCSEDRERVHNFISMLDFSIPCMATAVPSLSVRRR